MTSQVVHAAPVAPQAIVDGVVQVEPEQQPVQLVGLQLLHTPPAQGPLPQFWQAPPPLPHMAGSVPGRHDVPAQQPEGHEVPSHTQAPATQRAPSAQGAPVPHWHTPAGVQRLEVCPHLMQALPAAPQVPTARGRQVLPAQQPSGHDVASHTQAPFRQRWPAVQAAAAPQTHRPVPEQPSAVAGSQGAQALPAVPHFAKVGVMQLVPSQHPLEHEVAAQPH